MTQAMTQTMTQTMTQAMLVDFEVCEAFRPAIEHDEPVCASCGHLADDHIVAKKRVGKRRAA